MTTPIDVVVRKTLPYDPKQWPGVPEIIARIYLGRGIARESDIVYSLPQLIDPTLLGDIEKGADIIADAIVNNKFIMIAGDYDCDGATGTATGMRGLRMMGCKRLDFSIPNRFIHGYGVSPELIRDMSPRPDLIVTVDSGVSSVEGIALARSMGIDVVVTDHHLPGEVLPDANAIINPNLNGDPFPSKALAGVGVMFYTLLMVHRNLKARGWYDTWESPPRIVELLDLVAVGTVADLVPLDHNNRLIVAAGLHLIRQGRTSPGMKKMILNARCAIERLTSVDIAFNIGPRINAAGRLEDMRVGVMAMIETDKTLGEVNANLLEEINNARKEKTATMVLEAEAQLESIDTGSGRALVLYNDHWHSGIVGLVASRVKESAYRPVIALAPSEPGSTELRGSARSIAGFHLRDALAIVDARHPGLMKKFGGHAMAAGLSLDVAKVDAFREAFCKVADELIDDSMLNKVLEVDGEIPAGYFCPEFVDELNLHGPWGQGFPAPLFRNMFLVHETRVVKDKHLQLTLRDPRDGAWVKGIQFNAPDLNITASDVDVVFELNINEYNGRRSAQMIIRDVKPLNLY